MKRFYIIALFSLGLIFTYFYFNINLPHNSIEHQDTSSQQKIIKDKKRIILGYPSEFAKAFTEIKTFKEIGKPVYNTNYKQEAMSEANNSLRLRSVQATERLDWTQRGPSNVPGRARGFVIDPDDDTGNTIFVGSVGGGVWKTENKGLSWRKLTDGVINQATPTIAMAPSNHDILYVGTGEAFAHATVIIGDGIYKSTDRGESWIQLASTGEDNRFRAVNRIIIDPNDENTLLAVTETGTGIFSNTDGFILKSVDGGDSWTEVYTSPNPIKQIIHDSKNFQVQYASESGVGILKSTDGGNNWTVSNIGMDVSGRVEFAISPVNSDHLFASAQGEITGSDNGNDSDIYISRDAGNSWIPLIADVSNPDIFDYQIMNGQGGYSNAIAGHPFDENSFYVAGVDLFRVTASNQIDNGSQTVTNVEENGTDFMSYVNFGADFFNGALDFGNSANKSSVEIRFGAGVSQKAHRFTVNMRGPGVPTTGFLYQDYVDVPFEVWDVSVDPERQLMVSFRDQQENGTWELLNSNLAAGDEANHSREYIYIHDLDYDEANPNLSIAQNGNTNAGHEFEQMYFLWPVLTAGATFDPDNLPNSNLRIEIGMTSIGTRIVQNVTDGRRQYNGQNNDQLFPHVDYHGIQTRVVDAQSEIFELYTTNDGGITHSDPGTTPGERTGQWNFAGNGLVTVQPYGVDKSPVANEYIFGSQDNGTWVSAEGENASSTTNYVFSIGGDGFECVWHGTDPNRIIGGFQFNGLRRTVDRGRRWTSATNGLESGRGNAPFITKIANNKLTPDVLFALGSQGIYKSTDFGGSWALRNPGQGWSIGTFSDVKVSIANPDIVWAGTGMTSTNRIQLSIDQGETFSEVNNFRTGIGRITGLATHPIDPNTAYALFSFPNSPKILRTTNLGESWEDISGFSNGGESNNGFPNVAVFTLFVNPVNPDIIWAGTEIGLFESIDNGQNWALADNGIPNVSIWDIILVGEQVVVGTHGSGIWTAELEGVTRSPSNLVVTQSNPDNITLTWSDNSDNETAFSIERSLVDSNVFEEIGTATANETSFTDSQFSSNTSYIYRVRAISSLNSAYTTSIQVLTLPDAPSGLALDNQGLNNFTVSWTSTDESTEFEVDVSLDNFSTILTGFESLSVINQNSITITVSDIGDYQVRIRAVNGSGTSSNSEVFLVNVAIVTSSRNNIETFNFKLSPNPTSDQLTIQIPSNINDNFQLRVYDLSGSLVLQENASNIGDELILSTDQLVDGLYVVTLISANNFSQGKFIKTK